MKLFSDCSGECCLCGVGRYCVAGHGDDEYYPASKDVIIERLNKGEYPSYTNVMKNHLKNVYNYNYDKEKTMNNMIHLSNQEVARREDDEYTVIRIRAHHDGGLFFFLIQN